MKTNDYDPIASLYDIYVPATFDIDFFLNETKKSTGEVLELMSGTGRVSIPLLEAGVKLTCVDLSAASNALLQEKLVQKGLQADVYQMDVCELDLPKKFDMVIIPFHSFAHITSPQDQRKALERIREHLLPGGTFICTLGNPALRKQAINGQLRLVRTYPLENGCSLLLWTLEDFSAEDHQVVEAMQFYEEYDADGVMMSKKFIEIHFRLSGRDEFEELAKEAGFRVRAFYGDYNCTEFNPDSSPFMIWILDEAD
ncbi:MAG TPA: class I SAM-dependent methyltransferase [Anaerolineales bacterium]|nr:class I SAM-dependent methyltransferase [Anaerolineales bacterium]